MTILLLGSGQNPLRKIHVRGDRVSVNNGEPFDQSVITLDMNADHKPDVVWDLDHLSYPFEENQFDEIHAYDVLEHCGRQGDWRFFFDQFTEFWRILKPGGLLCGISPDSSSRWSWGDPGHTRVISEEAMIFLDQEQYKIQVGVTPMTDYRFYYKADFRMMALEVGTRQPERPFLYVIQAVKPSRIGLPREDGQ